MNILLVEDNQAIIKGLKYSFVKNNYNLVSLSSVSSLSEYLKSNSDIDLVILDVMLPDGDGFKLFEEVIKTLGIPTIFLTAKDEEDDIVHGLNIGAEDYVVKPFSTKELLAGVNRILLRKENRSVITVGSIKFDMDKMIVYRDMEKIDLTSLELKILNLLFLDISKVVSRMTILDKIWEWTGNDVDDHTVTVYLKRIREKLGVDIITTIKGIGYRIDDEK